MGDSRVFSDFNSAATRSGAGTVTRIRLENFMCHSNLQIELCPWLNFITGQNGSKSLYLSLVNLGYKLEKLIRLLNFIDSKLVVIITWIEYVEMFLF